MDEDGDVKARPFLKWAGGKRQLLPELLKRVPKSYKTYHEPFLGGGAVFFTLAPGKAILSDANQELVTTYEVARTQVQALARKLAELRRCHEARGLAHYLEVRQKSVPLTALAQAARMIYLNKTCFNGLYRVNKSGGFNVPMGKWKKMPEIFDKENLLACSRALGQDVGIYCRDFRISLTFPDAGDFVYLDPPYVPMTKTADFTRYTREGFGPRDQRELAELVRALKERGVQVLLSNAGNQKVRDLYPEPFFKVEEVAAVRKINCQKGGRGDVVEYLIS